MISGALALQVLRGGSPSSLPPSVSLSLAQGETASYAVTVTRSDTGAAENLTGGQLQFAASRRAGSTPVISRQLTLTTPASGLATLEIASDDTASLSVGAYVCDVWYTDSGGNRYPVTGLSALVLRPGIVTEGLAVTVLPEQTPLAIPACFFDGQATTTGAQTATIATYDLPSGSAIVINGIGAATRTDAPGFILFDAVFATAENDAGTITLRSTGTNTTFQTPAISTAQIALVDIGNEQVALRVTGVLGTTIKWRVSGLVSLVTT